ncbi:thermonuclease family protein [Dehalobacter sp. DCM]|uniref:thermonuclease family protein n=1 Tax=Dehalobacter sp. DCM TaxID=2907827 RepID=UPI003081DC1A|nr:thermonuclease family protein [Dehalobacter sp. DCM]
MSKKNITTKRISYLVIIGVILFSVVYGQKTGSHLIAALKANDRNDIPVDLMGPYRVVRVVDGDTIILDINGKNERVRLIGIDTPESVHPDQDKNVPYGKIAADYTKSLLAGRSVQIERDVEERDRYGRLLAYVYLDGEMVNKTLLAEGHASVDTYPPNVKYVDEFIALQKQAREAGKGFYSDTSAL